ncbi:hypothetical protein [Pseudogulbenkiania sp. MAI-1]|uniref:hypothetical protein n=1 Tax=Pseudogulbenkiania sp. MAI-1 TaxID=990370 RepID=UPI00045E93E5|nr:hypothetical protein [Pseudogulbenkiania sp. MAI-1]
MGIESNRTAVGRAGANHILPATSRTRGMTAGEVAMARTVFKDAIDYARVKIHRGGLCGLPNCFGNAMSPRGDIHFPDCDYREDFSQEPPVIKIWFIHEMTHVWQYQLGYRLVWNALKIAAKGGYSAGAPAYFYDLKGQDKGKTLSQFNMEQQGELVANYYAAKHLRVFCYLQELPELEHALTDFLDNPQDTGLLPTSTGFGAKPHA